MRGGVGGYGGEGGMKGERKSKRERGQGTGRGTACAPRMPRQVSHTREVPSALARYSRVRVVRTAIVQGFAQLGSDLLVDFDLMMTIPLLGPFFLAATQARTLDPLRP